LKRFDWYMKPVKVIYQKHYEIFADYHQFYLMDAEKYPNPPVDYTDEDVRQRIKAEKFIVVIQPERNMTVPVDLEILVSEPEEDFENWQHIAEASLDLPSGKLQIEECGGETKDVLVLPSGSYRIRAFYGDLDKLSFNGLDGDDHYKVVMWQAPFESIEILKQYNPDFD
jgi:hypothetical protein